MRLFQSFSSLRVEAAKLGSNFSVLNNGPRELIQRFDREIPRNFVRFSEAPLGKFPLIFNFGSRGAEKFRFKSPAKFALRQGFWLFGYDNRGGCRGELYVRKLVGLFERECRLKLILCQSPVWVCLRKVTYVKSHPACHSKKGKQDCLFKAESVISSVNYIRDQYVHVFESRISFLTALLRFYERFLKNDFDITAWIEFNRNTTEKHQVWT